MNKNIIIFLVITVVASNLYAMQQINNPNSSKESKDNQERLPDIELVFGNDYLLKDCSPTQKQEIIKRLKEEKIIKE